MVMNVLKKMAAAVMTLVMVIGLLPALTPPARADGTTLSAGDIAFVGLNSDGYDDFSFLLLKDIMAGTSIFITDKGWDDTTGFHDESPDGYWIWSTSTAQSAGTVVHIKTANVDSSFSNDGSSLTTSLGTITRGDGYDWDDIILSYMGDQLFIYQGSESSPTFITGIHWNVEDGTTASNWDDIADTVKVSELPDQLTNGVNAIWVYNLAGTTAADKEKDNFIYNCSTISGTPSELRAAINNISNWNVDPSGTTPYDQSPFPASFTVTVPAVPAVTSISPSSGPEAGGTSVTITGTDLAGASAVKFGVTDAASYTVNGDTQITATAPAGTGTVHITVTTAGGTSTESANDQFTYYDATAPAVTLTTTAGSVTNTAPIPVTATFSESVTGFSAGDITVTGGSAGNFMSVSASLYTFDITPSAEGTVMVDVAASTAQDAAGNDNTAATQLSVTYDTTPPIVPTVISTSISTNDTTPTWSWTAGGGGNGSFRYKLDDADLTSGATETTTASYTPASALSEGTHTLYVQERDAAGNWSSSGSFAVTVDTTGPSAPSVTAAATPTNDTTPTWSWAAGGGGNGNFRYKLDSADLTSGATETTAATYTPASDLSSGSHTLYVQERDDAGNWSSSGSFAVTVDTTGPTAPSVTSAAATTTDTTPTWSWTTGGGGNGNFRYKLDDTDLTSGATETTTASYTPVSALSDGTHTLYVQERDDAGNWSSSGSFAVTVDTTGPTVTVTTTAGSVTNASPILVTIAFSETVFGFTADNITVSNATKGAFGGAGANFTISITPDSEGTVTVDIAADVTQDALGNNNSAAAQLRLTYDTTAPTVTVTTTAGNVTNASPIPVTIGFSENVTGFTASDIAVTNGVKGALNGSGDTYTINITPAAEGAVTVDVASSAAQDAAGNNSTAAAQLSLTYDTTSPAAGGGGTISTSGVTSASVDLSWTAGTDTVTASANLMYKVVYSENDNISTTADAQNNGITAQDWTADITNATATGLSSSTTYYFNILIRDAAGNIAAYTPASETTAASSAGGAGGIATNGGETDANVEVNGESYTAGESETGTSADGRTQTTVTVDTDKLQDILESQGAGAVVTIPITTGSEVAAGVLTGEMVDNMAESGATLVMQTETATYTIPAEEIDINAISEQFGENVSLSDITVTVTIATPSDEMITVVENAADEGGYALVVPPVEFTITCEYNGQTIDVTMFEAYVERLIAIPDGYDPSEITTTVVIDPDGTIRHVPTQVIEIDGKYYAVVNSLTNSVYSVIYNNVEFDDVTNHWAKNAVNDMGSRMIVTGVGNNCYAPEQAVTRAEFAAMIVRALGLAPGIGASGFSDVDAGDWYAGYVKTAAGYGIINGYGDGTFGPTDRITREQAMTMLARAMIITGLEADVDAGALLLNFNDGVDVSDYAKDGVAACIETGIVTGKTNVTIAPLDPVTRAEVAVMIQRLLVQSGLI